MLRLLTLVAMVLTSTLAAPVPAGQCVSDCAGVADGDYQACGGCDVYVSCSNQLEYKERPCPAGLVWDDLAKRCEYSSTTCDKVAPGPSAPPCQAAECVSDCSNRRNGDYQSCNGCDVYVTCSNGLTFDDRPCPAGLVWDENIKRCEYKSTTCGCPDSRRNELRELIKKEESLLAALREITDTDVCVSDCSGQPDGDYQSCNGCDVYMTCSNGLSNDDRPCPAGLVWDDESKRCQYRSGTCSASGGKCVSSCDGLPDGDYQSCEGCSVFATCSNDLLYDLRPCPGGLVWDDKARRCERASSTCP